MRLPRLLLALAAAAASSLTLAAQERSYWLGNQNSKDIMEVTPWGKVLQRIDVGVGIRQVETNPVTGLTWVLTTGAPNIFLYGPGGVLGPIVFPLGTTIYGIAFDAQGDAWVTGYTGSPSTSGGVVQFDLIGNVIQQYPLTDVDPRGITIDSLGNKWIAHRNLFNAKVSRIDPAGVVTAWPVTGARPTDLIADFRGVGMPSHIWVQCDDNGSLLELDQNGTELNNYTVAADISGAPVVDLNGHVWVRKSNDANLYEVDPANGVVINTYPILSPTDPTYVGINGLGIDTLGRLLAVQRLNFGPPQPQPAPPCEVQRIDPATGTIEVSTVLAIGGAEAWGSILAPSTPFHYATVVAPTGDADSDGDSNLTEIQNGTSPIDASSDSRFSVDTTGNTGLGGTLFMNVRQAVGADSWLLAFGGDVLATPTTIPGVAGMVLIDPAMIFATIWGVGDTTISWTLPTSPGLAGALISMQGAYFDGVTFNVRNMSGISVW